VLPPEGAAGAKNLHRTAVILSQVQPNLGTRNLP
jgi:hypothetical protein